MPVFAILLNATGTVENVHSVTVSTPARSFAVKVVCDNCREETAKAIPINVNDQTELQGGTCGLCFKCKGCRKDISMTVLPEEDFLKEFGQYTSIGGAHRFYSKKSAKGIAQLIAGVGIGNGFGGNAIAAIEVRGGTPFELVVDDQFTVYAKRAEGDIADKDADDDEGAAASSLGAGTAFKCADLSAEFTEYDEALGECVNLGGTKISFCRQSDLKDIFGF